MVSQAQSAWKALSPDEKMDRRFDAWLAAEGISFASKEAERDYKARVKRFADAIRLKKPDRVPLNPSFGGFAAGYYGYTEKDMMYDAEKSADVALRATIDFPTDAKSGAGGSPGRVYDLLDYKLFSWPGHLVGENAGWQFNEAEYMTADEYEDFLQDPSDYWIRVHMPRILGALEPFARLSPAIYMIEQIHVLPYVSRFGLPDVQAALEKLAQAGREVIAWQQKTAPVNKKLDEMGFPTFGGGFCYAPFDFIGDTLRGTRGIIADMYRQPAKLLEALERTTPIMIKMAAVPMLGVCPMVTIPLHKGADGFMSDAQFKKFYWPSLLEVIRALNKEGLVPRLFAEGGYNTRLDAVRKDLSGTKTIWHFDYTDMVQAKKTLGDVACIMGNVPGALIFTGTPDEVTAYCRQLIDTAGKGGGYVMATGVG
ncbi:MAG TPA: uroporphyrinogen decarboxylase family protein, partial [Dehalococcoidales bacterium]|nr:uroporphyrinogen decarboxylase family protein [Dehalococcoidales bacterium]